MRRWNPLFLVGLLVVVLATVMSTTPAGASARSFASTSTNFKGKIVAKNSDTHYFVLSFTCPPSTGSQTPGWTYEVSSTTSFTGTVGSAGCSVSISPDGRVTLTFTGKLLGAPCQTCTPTMTLTLTNIVATKTFFNVLTPMALCSSSASPQPCLDIETSGFSFPNPTPPPSTINDFSSQCNPDPTVPCPPPMGSGFPYATLNLSAR